MPRFSEWRNGQEWKKQLNLVSNRRGHRLSHLTVLAFHKLNCKPHIPAETWQNCKGQYYIFFFCFAKLFKHFFFYFSFHCLLWRVCKRLHIIIFCSYYFAAVLATYSSYILSTIFSRWFAFLFRSFNYFDDILNLLFVVLSKLISEKFYIF